MPGTPREHPRLRGEGRAWSAAEQGRGRSDDRGESRDAGWIFRCAQLRTRCAQPPARARTAMGRVAPPSLFDRRLALWQLRRPDEADRGDHRQACRQEDAPRTSVFPATHPSRGRPADHRSPSTRHAGSTTSRLRRTTMPANQRTSGRSWAAPRRERASLDRAARRAERPRPVRSCNPCLRDHTPQPRTPRRPLGCTARPPLERREPVLCKSKGPLYVVSPHGFLRSEAVVDSALRMRVARTMPLARRFSQRRTRAVAGPRATGVGRLGTLARRPAVCAGRRRHPTSRLRVDRGQHRDGSVSRSSCTPRRAAATRASANASNACDAISIASPSDRKS